MCCSCHLYSLSIPEIPWSSPGIPPSCVCLILPSLSRTRVYPLLLCNRTPCFSMLFLPLMLPSCSYKWEKSTEFWPLEIMDEFISDVQFHRSLPRLYYLKSKWEILRPEKIWSWISHKTVREGNYDLTAPPLPRVPLSSSCRLQFSQWPPRKR